MQEQEGRGLLKLGVVFTAMLFLWCFARMNVHAETEGNYEVLWDTDNSKVTITGFTGTGAVNIPATLTKEGINCRTYICQ